ncbi:MAG: NTP transferase domain-containing protein, partial [Rhodospirillales bacterium]
MTEADTLDIARLAIAPRDISRVDYGMVLAAGRGTRLGALGRQTPKALLEVGGEFLIDQALAALE